jgi:hypothetical protein
VKKLLDKNRLEELGVQMEHLARDLAEQGDARMQVPAQTDEPAPL